MKKNSMKSLFTQRKFRYGTIATLLTIGVIVLVILVNITAGALEEKFNLKVDTSVLKTSELNEQTVDILSNLSQDVKVYTVYRASTSTEVRIQLEAMLTSYAAKSDHFTWDNIDPVTDPLRVNALAGKSISEGALIVTNSDESRVKTLNQNDFYYSDTSQIFNSQYTVFAPETKLTSAILYVTSEKTSNVYFLSGHDEFLPYDQTSVYLAAQLDNNNYNVQYLDLSKPDAKLEKGDVVVIADPSVDLSDDEYKVLLDWMKDGGRLLFAMDSTAIYARLDFDKLPNYEKLLDYFHLAFDDGYVEESKNSTANWRFDVTGEVPTLNREHEITANLNNFLLMPCARPIQAVDMRESGTMYTDILTTSSSAVTIKEDGSNITGIRSVGRALQITSENPEDEIRIVVLGSAYMLSDSFATKTGNLALGTNVIRWLVNDDSATVSITPELVDTSVLVINNTDMWTVIVMVVIVIPLIVAILGVVIWIRRRRL